MCPTPDGGYHGLYYYYYNYYNYNHILLALLSWRVGSDCFFFSKFLQFFFPPNSFCGRRVVMSLLRSPQVFTSILAYRALSSSAYVYRLFFGPAVVCLCIYMDSTRALDSLWYFSVTLQRRHVPLFFSFFLSLALFLYIFHLVLFVADQMMIHRAPVWNSQQWIPPKENNFCVSFSKLLLWNWQSSSIKKTTRLTQCTSATM